MTPDEIMKHDNDRRATHEASAANGRHGSPAGTGGDTPVDTVSRGRA